MFQSRCVKQKSRQTTARSGSMSKIPASIDYTGSGDRIQNVVFLRHGVAQHNVLDRHGQRPNLEDPSLLDPPLITEGKLGAVRAGEAIQAWWNKGGERIELIVTSPLTRCIQTAILAFLPGDQYSHESTTHASATSSQDVASRPLPLIVCKEDIREAFGKHFPDRRREKSVLERHWPAVLFNDEDMTEHDVQWSPTSRETWDDIRIRLDRFLAWLVLLPQNNIVVVSHGVSIEFLLRTYLPELLGDQRVYNTDAFACQCVSNSQGLFVRFQNGRQIHGKDPIFDRVS